MQPSTFNDQLEAALRDCRSAFWGVGLFSLAVNLLMLAVPIYTMQLFDRVVMTRSMDTLVMLSLLLGVSLAVMAGFEFLRSLVLSRIGIWLDRTLSGPVLEATMTAAARTPAAASTQAARDLSSLKGFLGGPAIMPLFDAPWAPIFLAFVFFVHPALGVTALAGALLLLGFAVLNERLTMEPLQAAAKLGATRMQGLETAVRNHDSVTAMGMAPELVRRWTEAGEAAHLTQAAALDRSNLISSTVKFTRLLLQAAILGLGAALSIKGEISGGAMIAASILMGRAVAPVEQAIVTWRAVVGARGDLARLRRLLGEAGATVTMQTNMPPPLGKVLLADVGYAPPGTKTPILDGISLVLGAGESLGIVGPSGVGKTTLLRIVAGSLPPSSGAVRLDGVDLAIWPAADRGRHIGYLPQGVELFDGTVGENVARFTEGTGRGVIAAAKLAGAHDMILGLPAGYDTPIGPGGLPISGGQKQRIGLARALFGQPKLVILDEPNANLDAQGEAVLVETLAKLKAAQITVLMVAQRIGIMSAMDKILVMRKGGMERMGPREEILAELMKAQGGIAQQTAQSTGRILRGSILAAGTPTLQ